VATPERPSRRRSDGERTHQAILDAAMRLASIEGLNGLTIGRLATELGVSKSASSRTSAPVSGSNKKRWPRRGW